MKVLWLCNVMMPMIAEHFSLEATNKEGWISGLADIVLRRQGENGIELAVAFPAPDELFEADSEVCRHEILLQGVPVPCYGFREKIARPEVYEAALEDRMRVILDSFQPDIVHCFGTEYPHTLAMCRVFPVKTRLLIGIQGLCTSCAAAYFADMPESAVQTVTFRDFLKKDSILQQQQKFTERGKMEREAISLAGNITGRTEWDRFYGKEWNHSARYYCMNETLRRDFYDTVWKRENCEEHSIFVSQGDYPIKGLHYMLEALPGILERYPDTKLYVAGNSVVEFDTIKQKLKLSGYGKYLRSLMKLYQLKDKVAFLGRQNSEEMKQRYLKSHLFVCCSSIENSPNSLGEAMLLGMPCVSADVGGIPSIFVNGEDGILYEGFRDADNRFYNKRNLNLQSGDSIPKRLCNAVIEMWSDEEKMAYYCRNARKHAEKTHNREQNYVKMTEIYADIYAQREDGIE
ncbi:MAG: glycosyltransferase family 4 protein [Acetatifactor sp.]